MLNEIKNESAKTRTENGALTLKTTYNSCLDLFASIGAMRGEKTVRLIDLFVRAYAENPDHAMRILFYTRDIRQGLGERAIFRTILKFSADIFSESVIKNIPLIPEYGRYDDLMELLGTECESEMISFVKNELSENLQKMEQGKSISLISKWLPSVNASSEEQKRKAKTIARLLGIRESEYRKTLSRLNRYLDIVETHLCEKDYSFSYEKIPSNALFKYRKAFRRNDEKRYSKFIERSEKDPSIMHAGTLYPYNIVRACLRKNISHEERTALDTAWNALPRMKHTKHNTIAVVDGSGSMYNNARGCTMPITVAISLGMYFAENNEGYFKNHFITFSQNPSLVEIKGKDIYEKALYCMSYNEIANTNIMRVFALILKTAINNALPQSELPEYIYIISDMEFDRCTEDADITIFQAAEKLYREYGYILPKLIFWNVQSRQNNFPVAADETGTVLVSGSSRSIFDMVLSQDISPIKMMLRILESERYNKIFA